jgi:hypothetical protein
MAELYLRLPSVFMGWYLVTETDTFTFLLIHHYFVGSSDDKLPLLHGISTLSDHSEQILFLSLHNSVLTLWYRSKKIMWRRSVTFLVHETIHKHLSFLYLPMACRQIFVSLQSCHVSQWLRSGFGLLLEFINNIQAVTAIDYYTIAASHNVQTLHTNLFSLSALVFTGL